MTEAVGNSVQTGNQRRRQPVKFRAEKPKLSGRISAIRGRPAGAAGPGDRPRGRRRGRCRDAVPLGWQREKEDQSPAGRLAGHNGDLTICDQGARNAASRSPGPRCPSLGGMTEPDLATPEAQPQTSAPPNGTSGRDTPAPPQSGTPEQAAPERAVTGQLAAEQAAPEQPAPAA